MTRRCMRAARWLARTYWPLVPTVGTVFGVWLLFNHQEFGENDRRDGWLLFVVGCGYGAVSMVVLTKTRHWSWRDLGQLLTYTADAMLYSVFGGAILGWRDSFTRGETNLLRALFAVGMPMLLIGLLWWTADTRFGTRDEGWAVRRWRQARGTPDRVIATRMRET